MRAWSPNDKISAGVSDLHVLHKRFYGLELKWVNKMAVRDGSNILKRPFTPKQILFLREVDSCDGGVGLGVIALTPEEAILVPPDRLTMDGNLSRSRAEYIYAKSANHLVKVKGHWNIEKILDFEKVPFKEVPVRKMLSGGAMV